MVFVLLLSLLKINALCPLGHKGEFYLNRIECSGENYVDNNVGR